MSRHSAGVSSDILSFDSYAVVRVGSGTIDGYMPNERFRSEDLQEAFESVRTAEDRILGEETVGKVSTKGLRCAEAIFTELAARAPKEQLLADRIDPDGSLGQDVGDHMYALAAHIRAIRENSGTQIEGHRISESRRNYYINIVDSARAAVRQG